MPHSICINSFLQPIIFEGLHLVAVLNNGHFQNSNPSMLPPLLPTPQQNRPQCSLLVISIRWVEQHFSDTNHRAPPLDRRDYQLQNLYEAYLDHPSRTTSMMLMWINLLRGILNESSWLPCWVHLMNLAYSSSLESHSQILQEEQLRQRNVYLIPPPMRQPTPRVQLVSLNLHRRLTRFLSNLVTLDQDFEGVTAKLFENQDHGAAWDIPREVGELDVCTTCCLNDNTGTLNYFVDKHPTFTLFPPSSFNMFDMPDISSSSSPSSTLNLRPSPISPNAYVPDISFLVWNVRGAGGSKFRRVPRNYC